MAGLKDDPIAVNLPSAEEARIRLAAIVESSDDAIISKTLDGIITSWNAAATRLFGYQPEEIIGRSILTLIPAELQHEEPFIISKLRAGERIEHYETRRVRKDGTIFDVSLTISPIKDSTGRVIGSSKIARDITERKHAQAALIQSEKLAAIGRMAAAIAHEVNNPLEAITNLAYLLVHQPSLDEEARRWARLLFDEVGRASRITKQSLAYYRDTDHPVPVNVTELVESVIDLHRPALMKKNIRLRTMHCDDTATVCGLASELRQVLANLFLNAMDAVSVGGALLVKVVTRPDGMVRIAVADNGSGIRRDQRQRLFEPFFTTKAGRGTGLGLWVSDGIVRKHGGRIRVHSSTASGRSGTIFTVVLPAHRGQAEVSNAA
ncbi:MAG TPA: PAS domain S-box protein [Terriglobales bacterium]|nr:PAS domain S-box protein [Terriglobales bacterium]